MGSLEKTKIFFDNENVFKNGSKLLSNLLHKMTHTCYLESLLYSAEGIYQVDEASQKLYTLDHVDAETEKITIFDNKQNNDSFTVFCDYGIINKTETFKYPIQFLKIKKCCYVFSNAQNSSLKLVVEKNIINDEIMDFYCILDKKLKIKDNANFYEELKEYNKFISIV
jgi:hypothetical protein